MWYIYYVCVFPPHHVQHARLSDSNPARETLPLSLSLSLFVPASFDKEKEKKKKKQLRLSHPSLDAINAINT